MHTAIAKRSLRLHIVQMKHCVHASIDSSVGRALRSGARGPGFYSRLGQWNSFKKTKFPFFNEDTLAIVKSEAS